MRSRYRIASARVHIVCVDAFRSLFWMHILHWAVLLIFFLSFHFIWTETASQAHSHRKTNVFLWLHDKCAHLHSAVTRCLIFPLKIELRFNSICYRLILSVSLAVCLLWISNICERICAFFSMPSYFMVIVISQNNNIFYFHVNHVQLLFLL